MSEAKEMEPAQKKLQDAVADFRRTFRDFNRAALELAGFGGLYHDECGCQLSDLMPCDESPGNCRPGYYVKARENDSEGHDFYIMPTQGDVDCYLAGEDNAE
jgi:hypothetical protein